VARTDASVDPIAYGHIAIDGFATIIAIWRMT
jgi:hypothetical protein